MNAPPIPLANRTLRQLHKPGGFHLSEFGYSGKEGSTVRRRQALRRMFHRGISMRYLVRRLQLIAILNNAKQPLSKRMRSDAVFIRQRLYPLEEERKQQEANEPAFEDVSDDDDDNQPGPPPDDGGFDFGDDNDNYGPAPGPVGPAVRGRGGRGLRGYRVGPYVLRPNRQPARRSDRRRAPRRARARGRGGGCGRGRGG